MAQPVEMIGEAAALFSPSFESVCRESVRRSLSLALLRHGPKVIVLKCQIGAILWGKKWAENVAGNDQSERTSFLLAAGLVRCLKYHQPSGFQGV